jgi:hypothetical protein
VKLKSSWYLAILIILILFSAVVYYKGQDIKQLVFGIFKVEFWPKQSTAILPLKDLREETKHNTTPEINQHTEGDQSPAIVSDGDVTVDYKTRNEKSK